MGVGLEEMNSTAKLEFEMPQWTPKRSCSESVYTSTDLSFFICKLG